MSGDGRERETSGGPVGERRAEVAAAAAFLVAMAAGVVLLVLYAAGGQTQVEGILLSLCLGGIGAGIIIWAQWLLPTRLQVQERHRPRDAARPAVVADVVDETLAISRRTMLIRALIGAFAGLAAALAIPVLSLGPAPENALFTTPWRKGLRLVDVNGTPINTRDVPIGGIATAFPEGFPGSAEGQVVLIHVEPQLLQLPADRLADAPDGYVAYSKLCTHAGCAVGLYRSEEHRLLCPCHQSTFNVLDGATPVFGPAVRPLPQLPIKVEADGTITALGDFPEPVGPSFWDIHQHG